MSKVSDRDPPFLGQLWQTFISLNGSKFCLSTSYHPQNEGQTKVVN